MIVICQSGSRLAHDKGWRLDTSLVAAITHRAQGGTAAWGSQTFSALKNTFFYTVPRTLFSNSEIYFKELAYAIVKTW